MFSITKNSSDNLPYLTLQTAQGELDLSFIAVFDFDVAPTVAVDNHIDWVIALVHRAIQLAPWVTSTRTPTQIAELILEMLVMNGTGVTEVSLQNLDTGTTYTFTAPKESTVVEQPIVREPIDHSPGEISATVVIIGDSPLVGYLQELEGETVTFDYAAQRVEQWAKQSPPFDFGQSISDAFDLLFGSHPLDKEYEPLVAQPVYEFVENASLKRIQDPHFTVAAPTHPDAVKRYERYREGLVSGEIMIGAPQAETLWTPEALMKENVVGIYRVAHAVLLN